jgi:hypothetical protein
MGIMAKDLGKKTIISTIDRLMQQGDGLFDLLLMTLKNAMSKLWPSWNI